MAFLNPGGRPFVCAVSAWLTVALCIYAWELLWVAVGFTGLVDENSPAGPAQKWGIVPALYASLPWSRWIAFPRAESIGGQFAFILALGMNALVLGILFWVAIRASRVGIILLRWSIKVFAGLTIVPIFFIMLFLNIDIVDTLLPRILQFVRTDRASLLGFLVSCPIPLFVGFLYYKLFDFLDRNLGEAEIQGKGMGPDSSHE